MPSTYTPIATQTLGSAAASVTFSSISGSYTDLIIVVSGTQSADDTIGLQFNSDTGSNYSTTRLGGDGSSASSTRWTNITSAYALLQFTTQNISVINIQNYSNSTTNKTVLSRSSNAGNFLAAWVSLWRNTAAITSIKLQSYNSGSNFAAGSTFTLYGVKID